MQAKFEKLFVALLSLTIGLSYLAAIVSDIESESAVKVVSVFWLATASICSFVCTFTAATMVVDYWHKEQQEERKKTSVLPVPDTEFKTR